VLFSTRIFYRIR